MRVLKVHYVIKNELDELRIEPIRDLSMIATNQVLYFHNDKRKCQTFINRYLRETHETYVGVYDDMDDLAWMCTFKRFQKDYSHYGIVVIGTYTEVRRYMDKHFSLKN